MNTARPDTQSYVYIEEISVPFSYPVTFTRHAFDPANPVLADTVRGRTLAYVDSGLAEAQPGLTEALVAYARATGIELLAPPRVLPGGEAAKDGWDVVNSVVAEIVEHRLCRQSTVLAIGGGAMLDAVGLAASLVHRGVRLVRMPSTTLSQDDGGVGVKTGINLGDVKNLIGTFAPPYAVINDLALLRTLPRDVLLDGVAEAFKVAIIKDAEFFAWLTDHAEALGRGEPDAVDEMVRRSAVLHLDHIRQGADPFEMGDARPLDFGHWAAHRLEGLSGYAVRHGQGVAIGIALDSYYAWRTDLIERAELDAILDAFVRTGLPVWHPLLERRDAAGALAVIEGIEQFREHLGGRLCITLPQGIGRRVEVHDMDLPLVEDGIAFLKERG